MINLLLCPICKQPLLKLEKTYTCKSNHSYDISSSGYTNLLLCNKKKTLEPGDNKEMTRARKEFLDKGYFDNVSNYINQILSPIITDDSIILDAGCGTGFYLDKLQKSCSRGNYFGIDISKFALNIASKSNKNIKYFVASIFDTPLQDNSIDIILNIFAPKPESEFMRILKHNGIIIEITPATNHLLELKKLLYDKDTYLNKTSQNFKNFNLVNSYNLTYKKIVSQQDIIELIKMTPYFYTTKKDNLNSIPPSLSITFDFNIKILCSFSEKP